MTKDIWKQPSGGPTVTAKRLKERLGYKNHHSINALVRSGPENGGLPGYIATGEGWVRKIGAPRKGTDVMFYEEHVQQWEKLHPAVPVLEENLKVDEQMIAEVLTVAKEMQHPDGRVNRKALLTRLDEKYGPGRWNRWWYPYMKKILDDYGIAPMIKQPNARRSYR